jgi:hypothetical protein
LLSKGLNFCPNPPKINVCELDEDLDQFARRLRIKEYFHSRKETSEDLSTDESDKGFGILWSKVLHGLIVYVAMNMHSL